MVATLLVPLLRGNQSKPSQGGNNPNANVFMYDHEVNIKMRSHSYDVPPSTLDQSKSHPSDSLTIEKPTIDIVPHPPKGDLCGTMHNANARAAHNENVVEEIAQAPCTMYAMEVLQYFPAQRKELLSSTRAVDPSNVTSITLDLDQSTCRIPSEDAFHIKVTSHGKNIFQTIVDEGASTCVMSFKCWPALGSPTILCEKHLMEIHSLLMNSL